MPEFRALFRRVDGADAASLPIEAVDIDVATIAAIGRCPDDEYVAAVWQADTPASLISWHARIDERQPARTVLVHLNVQVDSHEGRSAEELGSYLEAALSVGLESHEGAEHITNWTVALAEEV